MPSSSQSGPPQQPNQSTSRRLRSPEERFGIPSVEPEAQAAPDPFAAPDSAPSLPSPARTNSGARFKTRHQRGRFEREARRVPARRPLRAGAPVSASTSVPATPAAPGVQTSGAPAPGESPTLKRIRAERRRFWKRLGTVAALVLLAGATAAALYAPQMNISRVEITGLHATSPALIKPLAARLLGFNLFRADKGAVARKAELVPTVQSARVVLHPAFPPRVELRVVERLPVLRLGSGAHWWATDAGGNPYRRANAHDARLPAILWSGPIQTLHPLDPARFADAVRLSRAVGSPANRAALGTVRSARLDASGDAVLTLAAPGHAPDVTLKLGNDQWVEKLARARVAIHYLARTGREAGELNLISLRWPRWTPRTPIIPDEAPQNQSAT